MFKSPCVSFSLVPSFLLTASFYRRTSLVDDDTQAQDVVTAMHSSIWGGEITSDQIPNVFRSDPCSFPDLMMEVAEEEKGNRSF
jgi:hypothetical protein